MIDRQKWLQAHEFTRDPFSLESFRAETDLLLIEDLWVESYVDMKDARLLFGDLIGDYYIPGSRFIFSKSGGGKSSIRKRIHFESKRVDLFVNKSKLLVVDYIDHDYPINESSIQYHINRIVSLVEAALDNPKISIDKKRLLGMRSPKSTLQKLIALCDELGYKGIYVLVDNLDIKTYEKILPLALNTELNKIKGLVIKFFIPEDLFFLGQQTLPFREFKPYILQWEGKELTQILSQRLSLCLKPELELRTSLPGISFLCNVGLSETVQNYFIEVGKLNGPGCMWEFGYYLLEEHTKFADRTTDLIGEPSFVSARLRMFDAILKRSLPIDYNLIEYFQNKYKDIFKSSAYRGNKAKVFLCCIPEDHNDVYSFLFKPLESENYKPLMIQSNTSPGEKWRNTTSKMIGEADFFIPCFSSSTLKKPDIFHYALNLAKERQQDNPEGWIFIIPALIGKCTVADIELRKLKPLNLDEEDSFLNLLKALEKGMKLKRDKNP